MSKTKKDTIRSNLKKEFELFKKKTRMSQQKVSVALGWAPSFFGKMINGHNELNASNLIKICNFFDIPPTRIDPDFEQQVSGEWTIAFTTSGERPPKKNKMFKSFKNVRFAVWNDIELPIIKGGADTKITIPSNTTILATTDFIIQPSDPAFPTTRDIMWLEMRESGTARCHLSKQPPRITGATIFRIVSLIMV